MGGDNNNTYRIIEPGHIEDAGEARPVHIQYGDVRMDLPRLDDSRNLPVAVLTAGLGASARGWNNLTQDEKIGFMATILAYLTREYPLFERELDRKSGDKLRDIGLVVEAWASMSGADPKA